jgi:hypothetical protein
VDADVMAMEHSLSEFLNLMARNIKYTDSEEELKEAEELTEALGYLIRTRMASFLPLNFVMS